MLLYTYSINQKSIHINKNIIFKKYKELQKLSKENKQSNRKMQEKGADNSEKRKYEWPLVYGIYWYIKYIDIGRHKENENRGNKKVPLCTYQISKKLNNYTIPILQIKWRNYNSQILQVGLSIEITTSKRYLINLKPVNPKSIYFRPTNSSVPTALLIHPRLETN